jgi:hypothetical protein
MLTGAGQSTSHCVLQETLPIPLIDSSCLECDHERGSRCDALPSRQALIGGGPTGKARQVAAAIETGRRRSGLSSPHGEYQPRRVEAGVGEHVVDQPTVQAAIPVFEWVDVNEGEATAAASITVSSGRRAAPRGVPQVGDVLRFWQGADRAVVA